MAATGRRGIVVFAHGSRDALWRAPVEAVAVRIRQLDDGVLAICAYLELMEPTLTTAVDTLVAQGASNITVIPAFLGVGRHAREDLPLLVAAAQAAHPSVKFTLRQAVGEDPRLVALIAQMALE